MRYAYANCYSSSRFTVQRRRQGAGLRGSFSGRALISLYPLLSFSLASFWARWWPGYAVPLAVVVLVLVLLNLLQSWQYFLGMVNCCNMTWKQYKHYFFDVEWPNPPS